MRVFLYEWITGGGLVDQLGSLPDSLLREGSAIVSALAADFLSLGNCEVVVLRDMRLLEPALPGCRVAEVHSSEHWEELFDRFADEADFSLIVAPEFDGILRRTLNRSSLSNGGSLNASDEFVSLASDKTMTCERLAAAGLPTPSSLLMDADQERLPREFTYPGVLYKKQD
ncbi:MAG: hypothetical protein AAF961_18340, partial [Planctomycetota bacterium]